MLISPSGMVTEVNPVQSLNALAPNFVTPNGNTNDVRPLQL